MIIVGIITFTVAAAKMSMTDKNKNIWTTAALIYVVLMTLWGACIKAYERVYGVEHVYSDLGHTQVNDTIFV